MIFDVLAAVALLVGALLVLVASIGVARMPDIYMRMHSASKASSVGAGILVFGAAMHFMELAVLARAVATVSFIFLTTPLAAHLIARAAHRTGAPRWRGTTRDALERRRRSR